MQKVRFVNHSILDCLTNDNTISWNDKSIKTKKLIQESNYKYSRWLISKFSIIAKRAKLTSKQIQKMAIGESLTVQEKPPLTKMIYNKEAALAKNFTEICEIKAEFGSSQKI